MQKFTTAACSPYVFMRSTVFFFKENKYRYYLKIMVFRHNWNLLLAWQNACKVRIFGSIFLKIVICGGSRKQLDLYPYRYCPRHDRNVTLKFERKLFYVNRFLRGKIVTRGCLIFKNEFWWILIWRIFVAWSRKNWTVKLYINIKME